MKLYYILMALLFVGMVNAFTITTPQSTTFNTTNILFGVEHNETLNIIKYTLDNSSEIIACTNCSEFNTTLNLTEGEHTLTAIGIIGNITLNDSIDFEIDLPDAVVNQTNQTNTTSNETNTTYVPRSFSITIDDPESKTYYYPVIDIDVEANTTLDSLYAELGSKNWTCTNCSKLNDIINLTAGNYTLKVQGTLDNITKNSSVNFMVRNALNDTNQTNSTNQTNATKSFSISINSPESKTYYDKEITVLVKANTTLDSLSAELGSKNWTCTNCSTLTDKINLTVGNYTLKTRGILGNVTKNLSLDFRVRDKVNYTDDDEKDNETRDKYNESRFTTGFEKLPKMVANGELTDAELANIIRNNKLNPGVLNRLIKTGKLGNASINAILDTQFQPQGIFKKLFGWIGFKNTYSSRIVDTYNLTEDAKEKVVKRDDLPKKTKTKINTELGITDSDDKIPPGQAKKLSNDNRKASSEQETKKVNNKDATTKVPPGQAKKSDDSSKVPPGQAKKGN